MIRRLPPLNALRAFEASGRHLSFAKAADELGVTPPAISHQVRQLEDFLGVPLFRRMTRQVALTDAGRAALEPMSDAFDRLAEAVALITERDDAGVLTVSVAPSFAALWLVPRVEKFSTACPDIDLRISANMTLSNFKNDGVDAAIRYGRGNYPGLQVVQLSQESIAPMCSPDLLEGPHPLNGPEDLTHHTLLHDDSTVPLGPSPYWRMWLRLAGHADIDTSRGPRFSYADHALQAAIQGQGVVLGRFSLASAELAAGRLVRPFGDALPTEFGYYLVHPDSKPLPPKVAAFRSWVLSEVGLIVADEQAN